jgi:hypothetical protein
MSIFDDLGSFANDISQDLSSFINSAGYVHFGHTTIVSNPALAGLSQEPTAQVGYVTAQPALYNSGEGGVVGIENTLTQLITSPLFLIFILIIIVIMVLRK